MTIRRRILVSVVVAALFLALGFAWYSYDRFSPGADRIILLLPDGTSFSDPRVTVWTDAGNEEGLHVVPMHDSNFIRSIFPRPPCAGVILPDSVHQRASDLFVGSIHDYVATGGHLMLVYDAAVETLEGFYSRDRSRLSDLAGVDYALYRALGSSTIQASDVSGSIPLMDELGVPPGKYFPFIQPPPGKSGASAPIETQLRRYQYGSLTYPSFVTSGEYSGHILLHSLAGVVAGVHRYQKGAVLFVNLPLGYLKSNTDGLPLHAFLKYFGTHTLSLPYLLAVPDGVGGLVLDWHVDSNAAIQSLKELETWSIVKQGPYSIDVTAGPDTYAIGDGKGFDVLHNPVSQALVRAHSQRGDEIGSHGGWIHNYFAAHVETDKPKDMEKYLAMNKAALEQVTGNPVLEYSAPNGDQPVWVTHWLEDHGFVAYYYTGDTGMAPTHDYRGGKRGGRNIWAFPIVQMDRAASFEELTSEDVSFLVIQKWLQALTDFVVAHEQVRLAYFHPPGILPFHQEVNRWMEITAQRSAQGRFRWYTMTQMANFLNSRQKVRWKLTERDGLASLNAAAPKTLAHQTWRFPADKFSEPVIVRGSAKVRQEGDGWIVIAAEGTELDVQARTLGQ
jgi:polysaccharide deacetylase